MSPVSYVTELVLFVVFNLDQKVFRMKMLGMAPAGDDILSNWGRSETDQNKTFPQLLVMKKEYSLSVF